MRKKGESLKVLSSTASGVVIPYSMMDVQAALSRQGHQVYVQDIASMSSLHEGMIAILDGLVNVKPDVLFTIDRVALLPNLVAVLENPPQAVSWFFDDPFAFINDDYLHINSHYHIFCWDRAYVPRLKEKGFRHVEYQPFATNPLIYRPDDRGGTEYDVSFVGTASEKRIRMLKQLAGAGIRVDLFGDDGLRRVGHPNAVYHGMASNREDCPRIYSRSKINLNITNEQLITSLPVRVFDVLACGGFLLTDAQQDASELFRPGEELAVYSDPGDLAAKVRYYLEHENERNRIRQAGRAKVLEQFTFDAIVPRMLDSAFEIPADLSVNKPLDPMKLAHSLWLAGLSYLKFGCYREAYARLTDTLNLCRKDEQALRAVAVLANHLGQCDTVTTCMDQLESIGSSWAARRAELLDCTRRGEKVRWWDDLYRGLFPDVRLRADGTVNGWEPVPL